MNRGICIYCGKDVLFKKNGTLKNHRNQSKDCPGSGFREVGVQAVNAFIEKHEDIANSAEDEEVKKTHYDIADAVHSRHSNLLKLDPKEIDLRPYFQKKLGEHLKKAPAVIDKISQEYIFRLFDLEVIATDCDGVYFQVWSFSYSEFFDEGKYHDAQDHGVSYASFSSCLSVQDVLYRATVKYHIGHFKQGCYREPFLAHR